jgi:hypothetical protein
LPGILFGLARIDAKHNRCRRRLTRNRLCGE